MKNDPNKNGMTYASHTLPSIPFYFVMILLVLKCVYVFCTQVVCAVGVAGK